MAEKIGGDEEEYPDYKQRLLHPDVWGWCSWSRGMNIDEDELKARLVIPEYLRLAMEEAVSRKEIASDVNKYHHDGMSKAPESAVIVFINSRSGGHHGPLLRARLQQIIGSQQVFDLSEVKPSDFLDYGLGCLEILASSGDLCAEETCKRIRILVAGGDGTVGWVLGSIREYQSAGRNARFLPVGVIPCGTGNDLARSFGWGGSFPNFWKTAVKWYLSKTVTGQIRPLDSWRVQMKTCSEQSVEVPHALKKLSHIDSNQGFFQEETPSKTWDTYDGTFYNYFSVGMDAQVAFGFHHLRNEKPYLARGPITNKMIYSGYSCVQGWFCSPFSGNPRLRGLNNIVQIQIKRKGSSVWETLDLPSSVRAIVLLNLPNYAGGRKPWGNPPQEYMQKRGFVEARPDDGLLEVLGFKEGWHASFVMFQLITAKHLAQATDVKIELRAGKRIRSYLQMDGEPWKQPLSHDETTTIEITRVSAPSQMIVAN